MIKALLLLLLYLAASFAAYGQGCDSGEKNGDRIGFYLWHLASVLFLLALAFA